MGVGKDIGLRLILNKQVGNYKEKCSIMFGSRNLSLLLLRSPTYEAITIALILSL